MVNPNNVVNIEHKPGAAMNISELIIPDKDDIIDPGETVDLPLHVRLCAKRYFSLYRLIWVVLVISFINLMRGFGVGP